MATLPRLLAFEGCHRQGLAVGQQGRAVVLRRRLGTSGCNPCSQGDTFLLNATPPTLTCMFSQLSIVFKLPDEIVYQAKESIVQIVSQLSLSFLPLSPSFAHPISLSSSLLPSLLFNAHPSTLPQDVYQDTLLISTTQQCILYRLLTKKVVQVGTKGR